MKKKINEGILDSLIAAILVPSKRQLIKKMIDYPGLQQAIDDFAQSKEEFDKSHAQLKKAVGDYVKKHKEAPPEAEYLNLTNIWKQAIAKKNAAK